MMVSRAIPVSQWHKVRVCSRRTNRGLRFAPVNARRGARSFCRLPCTIATRPLTWLTNNVGPRTRQNRDRIGGVSCCARRPQATLPSRHFRNDASQDLLAQRQQSPSGVHLLRPKISKGWTDTMLKTTIAAAFVAAAFAGPAHAIPASSPAASLVEVRPELIQVRNHNKRNWNRRHYRNRGAHWNRRHYRGRNYYRGHRYRGWNRYSARPWNWRARGCASVGPLWFCP